MSRKKCMTRWTIPLVFISLCFVVVCITNRSKANAKYIKKEDAILYNNIRYKEIDANEHWVYTYSDRAPIYCSVSSANPFDKPKALFFLNDDTNDLFLIDKNYGFFDILYLADGFSLTDLDREHPDQLRIQFDYYDYEGIGISDPGEVKTILDLLNNQSDLVEYINKKYFPNNRLTIGSLTVLSCWNDFPLQYKMIRIELSNLL